VSLEDLFQGMLHDSVASAVEELGEERLVKILDDPNAISETMPEVVENSARAIVEALKRAAPKMLAERRDGRSESRPTSSMSARNRPLTRPATIPMSSRAPRRI
jgi:hypothetical protein